MERIKKTMYAALFALFFGFSVNEVDYIQLAVILYVLYQGLMYRIEREKKK